MINAYEDTYTPGSKTAVFYIEDFYFSIIKLNLHRADPPKLLKKRFMLESRVLQLPPHHFMFDIFDRKIQQYNEADLVNYNTREYKEICNPKKYAEFKKPYDVLTLADLEAGFVVSLVPLILSILIFALEWMPTLKNLIVFWFVFKKYFEVKRHEQSEHCELIKVKMLACQKFIQKEDKN